ncbi:MAG: hypothetical protein IKV64_01690 [Clostridia bacterium]|nr:hypothetical protein [Clostridia bacterium]
MNTAEKLQTIAENEQKVYEAGIQQGKQDAYNAFWDAYQNKGARAPSGQFGGQGWNDASFKPKYDIVPVAGWSGALFQYIEVTDLTAALERAGVTLNTSTCTSAAGMFQNAKITRCPPLDFSNCRELSTMFASCSKLETIDEIKVSTTLTSCVNCFNTATKLKNITITGVLACNGLDFSKNTLLTTASIVSVIEHLSSTATGKTATFSQTAVNNMTFPHTSQQSGVTYNSWDEIIATKQNWTISLA